MKSLIAVTFTLLMMTGSAASQESFSINLLHMNDTHSNLVETGLKVTPLQDGEKYTIQVSSAARTAKAISGFRESGENVIFLHAGDLVQGTLFYTLYGGKADAAVYNVIHPDVMVTGNHEFDRGSAGLSDLLDELEFPVVCANLDVSGDSLLAGRIPRCLVLQCGGERIGIIGLVTEELHSVSSPSAETVVLPLTGTAQHMIDSLQGDGINKIVLLTHIGYENDLQLASEVSGADVIVGGHTHTLLGDFSSLGLDPQGDYPTVVTGADGGTVLVVQAWCYGRMLGNLTVDFDPEGRVTGYRGSPFIPTNAPFLSSSGDTLAGSGLDSFVQAISADQRFSVLERDSTVEGIVEYYSETLSALENEVVAVAGQDLPNIRIPGGSLPQGSMIAPIVCDAMLWKTRDLGMGADIALQNAGGVRIDIPGGDITIGTVYRLLPFSNTLAVLELSGSEVREVLENALSDIFDSGCSDGAFPYVAGLRYTALRNAPAGERILSLEVQTQDGSFTEIDPETEYGVVTNAFVAGGGDGYSMLADKPYTDTGFTDSEVFLEYIRMLGNVEPVPQRVFLTNLED